MSIVSVHCKSLLRLFVVGVYCKYLLCFIVLSHIKKAKCWKSNGFIVFSLINLSKMSVLRVLDSKNVIKQIKNHVFCSTSCIFSENPCAKMHKTEKVQKSISFYSENFHRNRFWRLLFQKNIEYLNHDIKNETLIYKGVLQKSPPRGDE